MLFNVIKIVLGTMKSNIIALETSTLVEVSILGTNWVPTAQVQYVEEI